MSKWLCGKCGEEAGSGVVIDDTKICWACHGGTSEQKREAALNETTISQSAHGETSYHWNCPDCGCGITTTSIEFSGKRCARCADRKPDNSHYTKGSIEPWQYIRANNLNFFEGSIVKYITRWRHKNGLEDLLKVEVYIKELIRQEREQ